MLGSKTRNSLIKKKAANTAFHIRLDSSYANALSAPPDSSYLKSPINVDYPNDYMVSHSLPWKSFLKAPNETEMKILDIKEPSLQVVEYRPFVKKSKPSDYASLLDEASVRRGNRWLAILRPDELSECFAPDMYKKLVNGPVPTDVDRNIKKDITRTFPTQKLFASPDLGVSALYRILSAYAMYDMGIGYSQGLAFIAGFLLLHIDNEEDVFWCVVKIMFSPPYNLRAMYQDDCTPLKVALSTFDQCLATHSPQLYAHLSSQGISAGVYSTQWFVTLFSYRFPLPFVAAAWDSFLTNGLVSVVQTGLAVMDHMKDTLMDKPFEQLMFLLNAPQASMPEEVVANGAKINIISQRYFASLIGESKPSTRR